jgi:hypothetical protein
MDFYTEIHPVSQWLGTACVPRLKLSCRVVFNSWYIYCEFFMMQRSRTQMGADDIPTDALQRRVSARGERIQQRRAQRLDAAVDLVRGSVSPSSPQPDLASPIRQSSVRGPSNPLEDRVLAKKLRMWHGYF